ncbi:MAG: hypothetical protein D6720_06185 [Gammaproteobacteria bacterium]|nr:MAG: hypothetical protein D6720_06185 [Gammaproteobacteria bacterium]
MSESSSPSRVESTSNKPSAEFAAWCEAEFERRRNSSGDFDESHYRQAMELVLDKLHRLEEEGKA